MKPEELEKELARLDRSDLRRVLWRVRIRWLSHHLRPVHLLFPVVFAQMILFAVATLVPIKAPIPFFILGNFVIVSLAMSPILLRPARNTP